MPSRQNTPKNAKTRNPLEEFCWLHLEKAGIPFVYEKTIEIVPAFSFSGIVIEKKPKGLKLRTNRYQNIEYSPDFSGEKWIIETKGLRRPSFDLRWKLFKNLIKNQGWLLLMPGNQKEVLISIEILKRWLNGTREWSDKEILLIKEEIEQSFKERKQPKTAKVKKR